MKKISVVMVGIFMLLTTINAFSQNVPEAKASAIAPYQLAVTFSKTTSLVFPYAIKSVDRGSRDIVVQKAIGVENILQVKAAKQGFAETNLTVVTADGSLYAYVVSYSDSPASLSLLFSDPAVSPKPVAVFEKDATTDQIALKAQQVIVRERTLDKIKDKDYEIAMDMKGLYIHDEIFYFQLELKNNSAIDYDVQSLRFFVRDKKKSKRTAFQEIEMQPVYLLGNSLLIRHASEQTICVALPKFTIPDKKYLTVELMEKNGGRHLSIKISNKTLLRSSTLL